MKELSADALRQDIARRLEKQTSLVLATSSHDRVTARTVYCVSEGLTVYIITSRAYLKYKQMQQNPAVALCFDNVQLEGLARALGHPATAENEALLRRCAQFSEAFWHWAKYKSAVLIAVETTRAELWQSGARETLDVAAGKACRIG